MNLELIVRLNQDHLDELHRQAAARVARTALRLPSSSRAAVASRPAGTAIPQRHPAVCCQVAS